MLVLLDISDGFPRFFKFKQGWVNLIVFLITARSPKFDLVFGRVAEPVLQERSLFRSVIDTFKHISPHVLAHLCIDLDVFPSMGDTVSICLVLLLILRQ